MNESHKFIPYLRLLMHWNRRKLVRIMNRKLNGHFLYKYFFIPLDDKQFSGVHVSWKWIKSESFNMFLISTVLSKNKFDDKPESTETIIHLSVTDFMSSDQNGIQSKMSSKSLLIIYFIFELKSLHHYCPVLSLLYNTIQQLQKRLVCSLTLLLHDTWHKSDGKG